ncbi:unnamed protein product [Brachionus calyciflorus]|uniref:Coiled-coil domain-containing protein 112 n=1 Tax=Brachionus calyciflorus TaxID=104777 RepID=A0A814D224_9BILA|nr:unnamed protein product [Brachionus calyciflorus]
MSSHSNIGIDLSSVNYTHKNECLKMIKVLNHNLKNLEKEQKAIITNKKSEKDYDEAYEMYITSDLNNKKEKAAFNQKLSRIGQLIFKFKQESRTIKPNENFIDSLKILMEEVDMMITNSKEEILLKIEELNNEEKLLSKEIEIYDKKIQNWLLNKNDENGLNGVKKISTINDKYSSSDLLKEVIDFDKFLLSNGGHNGGWEEIDHSLFLKIRNKHKGKPNFIDELERMIATKSKQQIEQHEDWYKNYTNLNELKKEAIKKWKEQKNASKSEVVNLVDEELKLNQEIEKELKNRFEKKRLQEKAERNKRLNEWRIERELQKAKETERLKKEEELEMEKEIIRRKEQAEMKAEVMEYKRIKEELNEYIELEKYLKHEAEQEEKIKNAKQQISRFHSRDLAILKEKQDRLKAKQKEAENRMKILETTKEKVEIEYDPNRLYRMTSSWKSRVNTPRSDSCGPVITPRIPHLAVPSWRKGI